MNDPHRKVYHTRAMDEGGPLWRRILTNELLLVGLAAIAIMALAFHLATSKSRDKEESHAAPCVADAHPMDPFVPLTAHEDSPA